MLGGFSTSAGHDLDPSGGPAVMPLKAAACDHLRDAPTMHEPESTLDACPDCLAIGDHNWVHLRMCLSCGHVGCCDSSPNRHADAHYQRSDHPVMRSIELGESWRWCFVDGELG